MPAPARRAPAAVLAIAVLGTALLSGCTAYNDLVRFIDRAQGIPEYADVERLNEEVAFEPTEAPAPGQLGKRTPLAFRVAAGAVELRVEVSVLFAPPPAPLPLPGDAPQGRVEARLTDPDGEVRQRFNFTRSTASSFSLRNPPSGEWGIELVTLGEGTARALAISTERVA